MPRERTNPLPSTEVIKRRAAKKLYITKPLALSLRGWMETEKTRIEKGTSKTLIIETLEDTDEDIQEDIKKDKKILLRYSCLEDIPRPGRLP